MLNTVSLSAKYCLQLYNATASVSKNAICGKPAALGSSIRLLTASALIVLNSASAGTLVISFTQK